MSDAYKAAITSQSIQPALFVEADFVSGPAYLWTGVGNISALGFTWMGVGTLGSVSTVEEGANVQARGITLELSGIDPAILGDVLLEIQQGLAVKVYLGLFDGSGNLIADPIAAWVGRIDQPTIDMDGSLATITLACENRLVEMNVAVDRRYTNDDQQLDHPTDRGMEFVNGLQEVMIYWGRAPSSHNNI